MNGSLSKILLASFAVLVLSSFASAPFAEAARAGGGGGARGGGGGGARASAKPSQPINNSRADVRTNDVRSASKNNVNSRDVQRDVNRDVNVDVDVDNGCCGGWDHPVAAAAVVGSAVAVGAAAVGSMVSTVPASCVPVNYGGMVYQQCGNTWYQPQGSQYVVVNPPY